MYESISYTGNTASTTPCATCFATDHKYLMWMDYIGVTLSVVDYSLQGKLWNNGYDFNFVITFWSSFAGLIGNALVSGLMYYPF